MLGTSTAKNVRLDDIIAPPAASHQLADLTGRLGIGPASVYRVLGQQAAALAGLESWLFGNDRRPRVVRTGARFTRMESEV